MMLYTTQNSSDNLRCYPTDHYHSSDTEFCEQKRWRITYTGSNYGHLTSTLVDNAAMRLPVGAFQNRHTDRHVNLLSGNPECDTG